MGTANIKAMGAAIAALEKGMGGAFLQSAAAVTLRRIASTSGLGEADRDLLTGFLSVENTQNSDYTPQSGEVVGILKQLKETMTGELDDATEQEAKAKADFEVLEAA